MRRRINSSGWRTHGRFRVTDQNMFEYESQGTSQKCINQAEDETHTEWEHGAQLHFHNNRTLTVKTHIQIFFILIPRNSSYTRFLTQNYQNSSSQNWFFTFHNADWVAHLLFFFLSSVQRCFFSLLKILIDLWLLTGTSDLPTPTSMLWYDLWPAGILRCSSSVVHPGHMWMRLTAETLDPPWGHQAGGYRNRRDTGPGGPGGPGAELLEVKLQKG